MALEREYKYSLMEDQFPEAAELERVFRSSGFDLRFFDSVQQHDRYFDDDEKSLQEAGFALRRRTVNGKELAALKSKGKVAGALHERSEIELPLTGGQWPDTLNEEISRLTDPLLLRSRIEINTHRSRYRVSQGAQDVAEVAFDEVSAGYPGSEQSVHFTELEIEAISDTSADTLAQISDLLDQLIKLTPNGVTKLERAEVLLSLGASFQNG